VSKARDQGVEKSVRSGRGGRIERAGRDARARAATGERGRGGPGAGARAPRQGELERATRETRVKVALDLDGGDVAIAFPNGFFGHLLEALGRHGGLGLAVEAQGDVHVDVHHTVEDVGIVLGECLRAAVADGRGITRFGSALVPLDEALARAVIDVSGRGFLDLTMPGEMARSWVTPDFPMALVHDFLQAFADRGRVTLHVDVLKGRNPHHVAEACFKAVAVALRQAVALRAGGDGVPSTKGTITA
jgi:imidazoleglycerol-phosphate dehydratase